MSLPKSVLRWRPIVESEIALKQYPFAPELILSLMLIESRGYAGVVNPISGASGLLQVMPATLKWYNEQTKSSVAMATMREKTEAGGRIQIRVGLWVLGFFWRSAYRWLRQENESIPVSELARFGDAFYAGGGGKVKSMSKGMKRQWAAWEKRYPKSNITKHANKVWNKTVEQNPTWDLVAVDRWVEGNGAGDGENGNDNGDGGTGGNIQKARAGMIIGLILLFLASMFFKHQDGGKNE